MINFPIRFSGAAHLIIKEQIGTLLASYAQYAMCKQILVDGGGTRRKMVARSTMLVFIL